MARLRELRRRRVLTLEELAEKAGVGRNTIWRLEHGVMGAQPRTIRKLAKALNVEPEELVKTGDDNGSGEEQSERRRGCVPAPEQGGEDNLLPRCVLRPGREVTLRVGQDQRGGAQGAAGSPFWCGPGLGLRRCEAHRGRVPGPLV